MNKQRLGEIKKIIDNVNECKGDLDDVMADEQIAFDNMPENLQLSSNGERSEEAIDILDNAVEKLDEVVELLNTIY